MKYALVENGVVRELTDRDPNGRFHPSLIWVEAPSNVMEGWLYDGANFAEPEPELVSDPEPDPDDALSAAIEAATTLAELKTALLGSAPDARARAAGKGS